MDLYEIVMQLNGPVQPTGDHGADQQRLANMGQLIDLMDSLYLDIYAAVPSAERPEASMRAIGELAREFLMEPHGWQYDKPSGDSSSINVPNAN